jgi:hypothetical protein
MRQLYPTVLVGSLVVSVASAQEAPPAPAPKPAAPVASGSTQTSAAGSAQTQGASDAGASAKPGKRAPQRKAKKRRAVKGPVASFPAFRVLPDGTSRVNVEISQKVIVAERKAEGRVAYRIKGASVPVRTNRLPLETSFFRTPVARVSLVEVDEEDVELVVELRQPSTATYKVVETDAGMTLQVDFPAPAAQASAPAPAK